LDHIAGMSASGRKLLGPASDLWELLDDKGFRHTAIVFHPEYRDHNAINDALRVVLGFLESPMVTNLMELVDHDVDNGAFVYPTGECWSVAEVIRTMGDLGEPAGVRAGLELMYASAQILSEAADNGDSEGVYSHGGLTPWRIMLKKDGQVEIIGHALPQVEILQFHEDERQVPREDSFRYCPPERIEAEPEDLSSDLFGLSLIAFELMTGKPVYDGLVNDIRQQAARGEGSRRLFRFRKVLPDGVRNLLTQAIRPEQEDRFAEGDVFMDAVRKVLGSHEATGPSLMDVMAKVANQGKRSGKELDAGKTMMLSKDDIASMLDDDDDDGDKPQSRSWSAAPRRGGRKARRKTESAAEDAGGSPRQSRRRKAKSSDDAPAKSPKAARSTPRRVRRKPDERASIEPSTTGEAPGADVSALSQSGRWSRVSRSGARPKTSAADDGAESLEEPEPTPSRGAATKSGKGRVGSAPKRGKSKVSAAPTGRGGRESARRSPRSSPRAAPGERPDANALIARLNESSPDKPPVDAPPDVDDPLRRSGNAKRSADSSWARQKEAERASAAKVLDRILQTSGDSSVEPASDSTLLAAPTDPAMARKAPVPVDVGPGPPPAPSDFSPKPTLTQEKVVSLPLESAPSGPAPKAAPGRKAKTAGEHSAAKTSPPPPVARAPVAGKAPPAPPAKPPGKAPAKSEKPPKSEKPRARKAAKAGTPVKAVTAPAASGDSALLDAPTTGADVGPAHQVELPAPGGLLTLGALPAAVGDRAPDPIVTRKTPGGVGSFRIALGPGAKPTKVRLPGGADVASAVARLVGNLVPAPTDLVGTLSGWYRLDTDDGPLAPDSRLSSVGKEATLTLRFVPNALQVVTLEIAHGEPRVRLRLPVGSAVPVVGLVDHLARWLSLPPGPWGLHVGDTPLDPYAILADLPDPPELLVLKKEAMGPAKPARSKPPKADHK